MIKQVYLAGPMRGIPQFNFPAFFAAAAKLRKTGHYVFSPAESDIYNYGEDVYLNNLTGSEEQAEEDVRFSLRDALGKDLDWICKTADAVALLPGWENSRGAKAEKAVAEALGLEIIYL